MTLPKIITGLGRPVQGQGDQQDRRPGPFNPEHRARDGERNGAADDAPGHGARVPGKGGTPPGHANRAEQGGQNGLGLFAGVRLGAGPSLEVGLAVAPLIGLDLKIDLGLTGARGAGDLPRGGLDPRGGNVGRPGPQPATAHAPGAQGQAAGAGDLPRGGLDPRAGNVGRAGQQPATAQAPGGPGPAAGAAPVGNAALAQRGPAALASALAADARHDIAAATARVAGDPIGEPRAAGARVDLALDVVLPVQERIAIQAQALNRLAAQNVDSEPVSTPIQTGATTIAAALGETVLASTTRHVPTAETPSARPVAVAPDAVTSASPQAALTDPISHRAVPVTPTDPAAATRAQSSGAAAVSPQQTAIPAVAESTAAPSLASTALQTPMAGAPPNPSAGVSLAASTSAASPANVNGAFSASSLGAPPSAAPQTPTAAAPPDPSAGVSLASSTSAVSPVSVNGALSASSLGAPPGSQMAATPLTATNAAAVTTTPGAAGLGGTPLPLFNPFLARRLGRGPRSRRADPSARGNGLWSILRVLGWRRRHRRQSSDDRPESERDEPRPTPPIAAVRQWMIRLLGRGQGQAKRRG